MPIPFNSVFDLLNKLEKNRTKSWSNGKIQDLDARTIAAWFNKYNDIIPRRGPQAVAFLSCLFPERRPDRVFGLQVRRLETIIQRAQCLGSTRMKDLQSWRTSDGMDFASCVEHVMAATDPEHRPGPNVTLEIIRCDCISIHRSRRRHTSLTISQHEETFTIVSRFIIASHR